MSKKIAKSTLVLAGTIILLNMGCAYSNNEIKVIDKQFYVNKVKNNKVGYNYFVRKQKTEKNRTVIITNYDTEHNFNRNGFDVKVVQQLQYTENINGEPLSFSSKVESFGEHILIKGVFITPTKVSVTSIVNDETISEELNVSKNVLFPYAIEQLYKNNEGSSRLSYTTIDLSNEFKIINVNALKTLNNDPEKETKYCSKYRVSSNMFPNSINYEWRNFEGKLIKEYSSVYDVEQVIIDEKDIINGFNSSDIITKSWIPTDRKILMPFDLEKAYYKINFKNNNFKKDIISDERQKVIQSSDNSIYLKINNEWINKKHAFPVDNKGYMTYLKAGPYITSNDRDIVKIARDLAKDKRDATQIAKDTEKWVFDHIKQKDLSINFANGKETLKSQRGDCTEHSILLASLLRASGIPSKIVVGLIYNDNIDNAFVYHMWVKAYVGEWINLDPSYPSEKFSPSHIAIDETALNNLNDKSEILLGLINNFSNIKINVLDYSIFNKNISKLKINKPEKNAFDINTNDKTKSLIKAISLKEKKNDYAFKINLNEEVKEDYSRKAFYSYTTGNVAEGKKNFKKALSKITFNDDLSHFNFALKLSSLGYLNLANSTLEKMYENKIWSKQIEDIKKIYFPKNIPTEKQELLLTKIQSLIDYQYSYDQAYRLMLDDAVKLTDCDYTYYLMAKALVQANEINDAINYLKTAINMNPVNLNYKLELAKLYSQENNYDEAQKQLNIILSKKIYNKEFKKIVKEQDCWLKFKYYRAQGETDQNKSESKFYYGKYYAIKGNFITAQKELKKSIKLNPNNAKAYILLGDLSYNLNKFDSAKYNYQIAMSYDKKSEKPLIGLGNIMMIKGDFDKSLVYYKQAKHLNPNSTLVLNSLAKINELLNNKELAKAYYINAYSLDEFDYTANYNLAIIALDAGHFEEAELYLKKTLAINPKESEAWIKLALIQIEKKEYFLAETYLKPVNVIDNNDEKYYYYSALIDKNNQNYASAKNNLRKSIYLKPDYKKAIDEFNSLNTKYVK